jgi:hypothetical protein
MVPDTDDEIPCPSYHQARRTVTDDHVQESYAPPYRESFVQSEGEYYTVKTQHASPRDSSDWSLELQRSPKLYATL